MIINKQNLEAVIAKANEVNDHYILTHLTGNATQKYMDYILDSCEKFGVRNVRMFEVDLPYVDSAVYSMCVMTKDGADIVLAKGLNHCWQRYTICKELFHLLIDDEKYRNLDIFAHSEAVTISYSLDDSRPDLGVAAEFLAEVAAMEFLFPYAQREQQMRSGQPNYPAIAQQYRIPQLLVDRYLSPRLMSTLKEVSRRQSE